MSEIAKLTPECIWRNFDALTQVPRPSGHVEKVQQFLLDFAKKVGVEAFQDPAGNIKADKAKSTEKIDGAVATIMALDRAIRGGNVSSASVYDDRGILFI